MSPVRSRAKEMEKAEAQRQPLPYNPPKPTLWSKVCTQPSPRLPQLQCQISCCYEQDLWPLSPLGAPDPAWGPQPHRACITVGQAWEPQPLHVLAVPWPRRDSQAGACKSSTDPRQHSRGLYGTNGNDGARRRYRRWRRRLGSQHRSLRLPPVKLVTASAHPY